MEKSMNLTMKITASLFIALCAFVSVASDNGVWKCDYAPHLDKSAGQCK